MGEQVEAGTLEASYERKGAKEKPLVDSIAIARFLIPLLHILLGIGNPLFDVFKDWVYYLEAAPTEVKEARGKYFRALNKLDTAEQGIKRRGGS